MNIVVFDTETTNLEKPFCYNIGFVIYNTELREVVHKAEYICEQIWHNRELFTTAYYAEKRELYIKRMKAKKCKMEKIGYITQKMSRLFKEFEVECGFAYNSGFDEKVFEFNCEWFKIINPFDNIPIYDIRGYVHKYIAWDKIFQAFCDKHERFTEKGNYSTTAETVFQYIKGNPDFEEEHTALADSEIECEILQKCVDMGAEWGKAYKVYRTIPRQVEKVLEIKTAEGETHEFKYKGITEYKEKGNRKRIRLK